MARHILLAALLSTTPALWLASPTVASAQTASDEAKKKEAGAHFKEAQDKFAKLDYAGALGLYQKADAAWPGVKPKYFAAVCFDKLGNVSEAVRAYERFLDAHPDAAKFGAEISQANARLSELKATPANVTLVLQPVPPLFNIAVDGKPMSGTELVVPPGKHELTVKADGFSDYTETFSVEFAEAKRIEVALSAASSTQPAASSPSTDGATSTEPSGTSKLPAYITLGLAGAGAVVGTIFGIKALGSNSDFEDTPTAELADQAERDALIADMAFGVAVTFGITGAVLLWTSSDEPSETARSTWIAAPFVSPSGGGAAARMTF